MKTLMSKAHKLAKTFDGHYQACLKLALKILWCIKKTNEVIKPVTPVTPVKKNTIKEKVKSLAKKTKNFFLKKLD